MLSLAESLQYSLSSPILLTSNLSRISFGKDRKKYISFQPLLALYTVVYSRRTREFGEKVPDIQVITTSSLHYKNSTKEFQHFSHFLFFFGGISGALSYGFLFYMWDISRAINGTRSPKRASSPYVEELQKSTHTHLFDYYIPLIFKIHHRFLRVACYTRCVECRTD